MNYCLFAKLNMANYGKVLENKILPGSLVQALNTLKRSQLVCDHDADEMADDLKSTNTLCSYWTSPAR